ncbi:MAG: DUF1223 domain-containing protein [Steroidobacteraceae bacterium]
MRRLASLVLLALAMGSALAAEPPVVVELFTSLACSDCPAADALLARVRERYPDVLALDLHVTYWNDASWSDPYSLPGVDELQKDYAALRHDPQVYTPEAVVEGGQPFVGSDGPAMAAAIEKARARILAGGAVPIAIGGTAQGISVDIGSGQGAGTVWLFGFNPSSTTSVRAGENAGAMISEVNVVRSITRMGEWHGRQLELHAPLQPGTGFAVILQNADGTIRAAASSEAAAGS